MKTQNTILMKNARLSLKDTWGINIGATAIFMFLTSSATVPYFGLVYLVLIGPLILGWITFSLSVAQNQEIKIIDLFKGFNTFGASAGAFLLSLLYTILWSMLLIVPGIIAIHSYAMTFYIIADNKSISASEAIKASKKMMYRNKWKLFCLELRFLGWIILSILTFGILFLWVFPYIQVSISNFYNDIKDMPEITQKTTKE